MQQNGFSQYNGPPSCDDANRATVFASNGDVSDSRVDAYRCEGCGFDNPADFDVTELEWNTDQGHFTIYGAFCLIAVRAAWLMWETENSGYQITPADGGPLRGHCVRDSGDDLQCSFGPSDNFQGTRLFICYSDLTAVDFAN